MEAEKVPAPEQSAQALPTHSHDNLHAKIPSAASAPRPNSTESTSDMGINHITNVRADGDDMTIGFLGARPYEKSSLEAEPSIPAYPNMNEADRANDRAKSDGDVIMADTQSSNQGVLESETRRTPGQAVKVTALEEGGTSSSRISAPVVGEKGTIKQETFKDDSTMRDVSDPYVAESTEGAVEIRPLTQTISSPSTSSDTDVRVPATDEEDPPGDTDSRNPQDGFVLKANDVLAPDPALAFKEEQDIKQKKLDDESIQMNGPDGTINDAMEDIRKNEYSEATRDKETREDLTDSVPASVNGNSLFEVAEFSDVVSAAEPDKSSDKQQGNVVSIPPRTFHDEVPEDKGSSDLLISGPGVDVDHMIKNEESATSLTIEDCENMAGKNEKGSHAEPTCPGIDAVLAVKVKDEISKVVTCAYDTKQKDDIEQKHCELLLCTEPKVDKEPESLITTGEVQDGTGSRLSSIPQGDGSSEENISNSHTSAKPSRTRMSTRQQSHTHQALPGSAAIVQSTAPHKGHVLSIPENAGQHDKTQTGSGSNRGTQEAPQARDGVAPSFSTEQSSGQPLAAVQTIESAKVQLGLAAMSSEPSIDYLDAYHNLFLVYYSRPPLINNQDIGIALKQSEHLIEVARLYGNIPMVRPYINNALMQFGRELYMAVTEDPPRWVLLAFYVESAPIFQECIIHMVANYPYWPWPTSEMEGPLTAVLYLVEKKLRSFETLKKSVNKALFSNEIRYAEVFSRALTKDDFDTWFVVQYWRDWFTRSLAEANGASESGQKCVLGKVYRDLRRSGEAYLPTILVLDAVEACRSTDLHTRAKRQGVERDLKTLKDFAQKAVEPLCVNYSMLSVEDAGIDYLTCIKVEDHELPWVKSDGNFMQSGCLSSNAGQLTN